jgi:hypothetical protein
MWSRDIHNAHTSSWLERSISCDTLSRQEQEEEEEEEEDTKGMLLRQPLRHGVRLVAP